MKIAAVQLWASPGDIRQNLRTIRTWTQKGAQKGCRLLLFPELSDLGYNLSAVERIKGTSWPLVRDSLSALAKEYDICLVCGLCLEDALGLANALVAFGPRGDIVAVYRKIHLFQTTGIDETKVFSPGSEIVSFDVDGLRFGLSICYDLRFPELFRAQALAGCHCLLLAAAWPKARGQIWRTLCTARAMENQCYLLGANQFGGENTLSFGGQSLFVSPAGTVTAGEGTRSGIIIGNMERAEITAARRDIPALAHRRPDLYGTVRNEENL